ncbi:hypothetical protein [Kitasatospora sp. NPDC088351]|uniref:hypothetical protein n=1 Tax=Kitasatospora sp. NPDC088351 TaxID=3155180 RepID=UPI00344AD889
MKGRISVRQALGLLTGVWLFLGGAYLVALLFDDPGLTVWAPATMYAGGWWARHRPSVRAGLAGTIVGCAVAFLLVDILREHLSKAAADGLAAGTAMIPVAAVLVVWTHLAPAFARRNAAG